MNRITREEARATAAASGTVCMYLRPLSRERAVHLELS
jgi:hypothetical protein